EAFSTASELLVPADFYRAGHQRTFEVMMQLADKGEPIDLVTVTTALANAKQLEEAGGVSYLSDVASSVPTAANIGYYSK
ncbi:DnaB-like helicase N-terminal domain-containing protein, partial [Salmonella enterica]|uniref:DnaB-like helicase N-terminal domain-containing protein n=1 Tax=Salmonella enterica TaxID=28901 RepID=UPI003CEE3E61